jgi:hypothetical protein
MGGQIIPTEDKQPFWPHRIVEPHECSIQRFRGIHSETEDTIEHNAVELAWKKDRLDIFARANAMIDGSKTCLSGIDLERVKFFLAKEAWVMEGVPSATDEQDRVVLGIFLQFWKDDFFERDSIGAFLTGVDTQADEIPMQPRAHFRSKRRLAHEGSSFPCSRSHAIVSSSDSEAGRDWYPKQSRARWLE